jgi:Spy/CpxP family protein refolding chaperone|tara:strand:- start:1518 stop:1973 length:456 start_codon:yes stop_codon:yes gene_type:complete
MKKTEQFITFAILIICMVSAGVLVGQLFKSDDAAYHSAVSGDMHALFHRDLKLNEKQDKELQKIEKRFYQQKTLLEEQMKLANLELAEAIKSADYSSSEVQKVVDKIHAAMGKLQKLTLQHLTDMQPVLSDEQNRILEEKVVEQLYRNAGR